MKVVYWNIRGISKSKAIKRLRKIVRVHSPDLLWISEPMIHFSNSFCTRLRLRHMSNEAIHNATDSRKGNIWLMWKSSLPRPTVLASSSQAITIQVDNSLITGVHAHVLTTNRRDLWDQLIDSHSTGIKYTWCNNQIGQRRILCKLDRAFYNSAWTDSYGIWSFKALTRAKSDHSPLVGSTASIPKPRNSPFRFQNMWLSHNNFLETTKHSWDAPIVAGNRATRFAYKLKRLKDHLKEWNTNVFGDISIKMRELEGVVNQAMHDSDGDPENLDKLSHLLHSQRELDTVSSQYDIFMGQKAKVKWIAEGDRNTAYLHSMVKIRRNTNQILNITDDEGHRWSSQPDIKASIVKHYEKKFTKTLSIPNPSLLSVIPRNIFDLKEKVSDLIVDGYWSIPSDVASNLYSAGINPGSLPSLSLEADTLVWKPSLDGCYSISNGVEIFRDKFQNLRWPAKIWRQCIHPKRSATAWKILSGCCATDARIQSRGILLASRCNLCQSNFEDDNHLFWDCSFVTDIWGWILELFGFIRPVTPLNFMNLVDCAKNRSDAIQDLWTAAITYVITEVWLQRNSCIFENKRASQHRVKQMILAHFFECSILMKGNMHNRVDDLMIFNTLKINTRPATTKTILECFWIPPAVNQLKIGCDGCSRGNPGRAGAGIVLRGHNGSTLGAMAVGLGTCNNFVAEVLAVILGLEWAIELGWTNIWVTSDSQAAIRCFTNNKVPWFVFARWNAIKEGITIIFSFVFRETNFAADTMSKRGVNLPLGTKELFDHRPNFLAVEKSDSCYYRFS
ncbi:Ribonuclease H domain [Macleaya cordata]|uniref:Ribonuclease H domain n=1 Tax=Macleaya cordata TaxID=56857 RepID=A0A200QBT9_MACCD|nr:Ribonuclease H domain [Macleaya cordata]